LTGVEFTKIDSLTNEHTQEMLVFHKRGLIVEETDFTSVELKVIDFELVQLVVTIRKENPEWNTSFKIKE